MRVAVAWFLAIALTGCTSWIDEIYHPGYNCVDIDDSQTLRAWWDMVPATGFIKNLAGADNASFSGAARSMEGKVGVGWSLESASHTLTVGGSAALALTDAFTVLAWVKPDKSTTTSLRSAVSRWKVKETLSPASLTVFDSANLAPDLKGYRGAVFDGRYVYFIPFKTTTDTLSAQMLRYDTLRPFSVASSWESYTPGTPPRYGGYIGGAFDGRYLYFAPFAIAGSHSNVLRFDTTGSFAEPGSWKIFDAATLDSRNRGYVGAAFDGKYVYFVPHSTAQIAHARVLRYNTQEDFENGDSWTVFQPSSIVGDRGYNGVVFDGRYLYFVPSVFQVSTAQGIFLRYDIRGDFSSISSWTTFNAQTNDTNHSGYAGGTFDGRYVYFAPLRNEAGYHGNVLRYDTSKSFTEKPSWESFNAAGVARGIFTIGYAGAAFDGRYAYFIPQYSDAGTGFHGALLRYDTQGTFTASSSWSALDTDSSSTTPSQKATGYYGAAFDGRHLYLSPAETTISTSTAHGRVLRYDTTGTEASYSLMVSGGSDGGSFDGSRVGARFLVNLPTGPVSVTQRTELSGDWHLLAGTFDSQAISLYVDGELVGQQATGASLGASAVPILLGGNYSSGATLSGTLDEVQIFNRVLTPSDVSAFNAAGSLGICR